MAAITCDLCGGAIRMQANQTGKCSGCGMEYDLDALREKIGSPAPAVPVTVPTQPTDTLAAPVQRSDEVDRRAMLVYLNDVRVMETIISETKNKIHKIDEIGTEKTQALEYEEQLAPLKPDKPDQSENSEGNLSLIIGIPLLILGFILISIIPSVSVIFIGIGAFCLISGTISNHKGRQNYREELLEYECQLETYEDAISSHRSKMEQHKALLENFNSQAKEKYQLLNEDIEGTKQLLQKAYSANIIPQQFRNIQGVYYLYDYLATSHQSLSEALMQCNLEAIKQKLDKMIQLQSEQIIQQAVTNAKLSQVYEVAEATMNNTALAAKYSAIAAVNSEITKRLASKQLAYQAADFWLK